jgi:hypothetical protein
MNPLSPVDLDNLSINTIRFLSIDAIQKAKAGTLAYRWVQPLLDTFYGRAFSSTIHPTLNGSIAIASSCRPGIVDAIAVDNVSVWVSCTSRSS